MDGRRRRQQISIRQNHPVMDVFVLNILDRTFTYTATFLVNYFHLHLNELMPSCERASACTLQSSIPLSSENTSLHTSAWSLIQQSNIVRNMRTLVHHPSFWLVLTPEAHTGSQNSPVSHTYCIRYYLIVLRYYMISWPKPGAHSRSRSCVGNEESTCLNRCHSWNGHNRDGYGLKLLHEPVLCGHGPSRSLYLSFNAFWNDKGHTQYKLSTNSFSFSRRLNNHVKVILYFSSKEE